MSKINKQPLITFALFAYNQESYIKEAVNGAFSQDYSPLEIILSDDHSTDDTYIIMKRLKENYQGPHKIILNQNKKNLGFINHINKVFTKISNGEIIITAAGDDISLPTRVKKTMNIFNQNDKIYSISMDYKYIDKEGRQLKTNLNYKKGIFSIQDYIQKKQFPILGCTRAYRKELIEFFPKLDKTCGVEDSNLVFRAILMGEIYHSSDIGIYYRTNINSLSKSLNYNIYQGILNQRKKDLNFAKNKKIIDDKLSINLKKMNDSKERKHNCIKMFYSKKNIKYFIFHILFNNDFIMNEKKIYFKILIKNIIKQNKNEKVHI